MLIMSICRRLENAQYEAFFPLLQPFFAERVFRIFDKDGSNSVSMAEFRECLEQFCSKSVEDKVYFLFKIYDQDGKSRICFIAYTAVNRVLYLTKLPFLVSRLNEIL